MRLNSAAAITAGILLAGSLAACSSSDGGQGATTDTAATTPTASATPNGVQELGPEQTLKATTEAATAAESLRATTTTSGNAETVLDLQVTTSGAQGFFEQLGRQELVVTADAVYIKGTDEYFRALAGQEDVTTLTGKWLKIPKTDPRTGTFASLSDVAAFMGAALRSESDTFTKTPVTDCAAGKCVGIRTDRGILQVGLTGPPYPVTVAERGGEGTKVTFSEWDVPVTIAPPPAEEVVDLSQLATGSPTPASGSSASPTS